jgi:hypothetical protein
MQVTAPYSQMGLGPNPESLRVLVQEQAYQHLGQFGQSPPVLVIDVTACAQELEQL